MAIETSHARRPAIMNRTYSRRVVARHGAEALVVGTTILAVPFGIGIGALVTDAFKNGQDGNMGDKQHVDSKGVIQLDTQARSIPGPVPDLDIELNGWNQEVDAEESQEYLDDNPAHTLHHSLKTSDGETIADMTLQATGNMINGNIRDDENKEGHDSYQFGYDTTHTTDLILESEVFDEFGTINTTEVHFTVESYTYTPDDPEDHERVFSEIDIDKEALKRAHEVAKRFDMLLPDVVVFLYDATDTDSPQGSGIKDYYDQETGHIRLPVQYFTDPKYPLQGDRALFHIFTHAMVLSDRNSSATTVETGEMEQMIKNVNNNWRDEKQAYLAKLPQGQSRPDFLDHYFTEDLFASLRPKRFETGIANDNVFNLYEGASYLNEFTDGMSTFADFANEFIEQFLIEDPKNPMYLQPDQQQRALLAGQHIFRIFRTFTDPFAAREEIRNGIIPNFDRLEDFVNNYQVIQAP